MSVSAMLAARRSESKPDWHLPIPGGSHPRVAEIQRARLLSATISAVEEHGYSNTSVAHITSSARVSRRTFCELFCDREACLAAALEDAVELVEREIAAAGLDRLAWRERIRVGLWRILSLFDREPVIARFCVVQALRGGPEILKERELLLGRLVAVVDEGRLQNTRAKECTPLTAEGLVGAAFSIVYARVLLGEPEPLVDLLGELMGLIVLPYLGPLEARRERTRTAPEAIPADQGHTGGELLASDPLAGIPIRWTYRTTRVLECVAAEPGVSNRRVADHAGIADQGQASKLLSRLERTGLVVNTNKSRPKGEANAWMLTDTGRQVARIVTAISG